MDYSTKVTTASKVLTLLLVVGAVSCSPLPSDPSSLPTSIPATHLETPVHSIEVSHEVRHVSVEVNEHPFDLSITSDQDEVSEHFLDPIITSDQDAADSTPEQEPPLPSDNPTSPYNIRHLGFTPTGFIDTLHPVYSHATPPKIIEAKDSVQDNKQDEEVVADAAADTISSHDVEVDNEFPQPDGEPEDEYIGLELDEPLKDIADQISVISDQAKNIWEPIQDDISKNIDNTVKSISDATNDAIDDTVKSINHATNEAKNILEPIQDNISKNIDETIKSINEASDEHMNSAADSIKNAVEYIKTAAEPITSDDLNVFSTTESENDFYEDINEDFEIIGDDERAIFAEARVGSEDMMKKAKINMYEEFGDHREADIVKKDKNLAEHTLEADSLNNIPQDNSNTETIPTEDTTEVPVLLETPPQEDQPALDLDQDQKNKVEKESIKSIPKDNTKEESKTKEQPQVDQPIVAKDQDKTKEKPQVDQPLVAKDQDKTKEQPKVDQPLVAKDQDKTKEQPQVDQPLVAKDQEEKDMFIDAVKRSDTGIENSETPQVDKPLEDATLSESPRESRVYIEKVDGIPKEKLVDSEDAPKDIPEHPVQEVPEISEEDSAQESSVANSPIPNVNHEEDLAHPKEPHGDAKMATDLPIESVEKESELSHDIPIDLTKNKEISKNKESIPKIIKESTLNNNENKEDILEENVKDVKGSGDVPHVDEEVPVINEDGTTVHEPKETVDEATEAAAPVIPSVSGDTTDAEYVDPFAGVPHKDRVVIHHGPQEAETSPPNSGIVHPKADQNDQVHHHKLSASDNVVLPPSLERVSIAEPHPLSAGSIVGIIFGVLIISGFVVGIAGFIVYQRRFHIRPKTLNSDRGYAGSDSGGYIDDDQCRVSYVNSQTDVPKPPQDSTDRTFRLRLNTQD